MPEATFNHPLFGSVRFRTAHSSWVRGDKISFVSGFNIEDIQPVTIPQLAHVPGSNHGALSFHKRAHAQVLAVFADIEHLGLLHHIKTCGGALNFRLRKPTNGALSKLPSNHAFGIAIDLNEDDGSLGSVERGSGASMKFKGPSRTQSLAVNRFGNDLAFVSLPQLAGIAGFSVDFDNTTKTARLIKIST